MRKLILPLVIALLAGCSDDDKCLQTTACGITGQFEELSVFKSLKESITNCSCITSILMGTYEGETVFYVAVTDPTCDSIFAPTLYNCDGEIVRVFENTLEEQSEFFEKVVDRRSLYDCNN
jgi:hypothetical protein